MNITLSVDDKAIESARQRAKALGSSVNQLVREYPNNLRAKATPSRMRAEFEKLSGLRNATRAVGNSTARMHKQ